MTVGATIIMGLWVYGFTYERTGCVQLVHGFELLSGDQAFTQQGSEDVEKGYGENGVESGRNKRAS